MKEHRNISGQQSNYTVDLVTRGRGDYFGERSLLKDEPRNADVIVMQHIKIGEYGSDLLNVIKNRIS